MKTNERENPSGVISLLTMCKSVFGPIAACDVSEKKGSEKKKSEVADNNMLPTMFWEK